MTTILPPPSTSLVPDIAVFEWGRIPLMASGEIENQFLIYPDWVIEILSPDQLPLALEQETD